MKAIWLGGPASAQLASDSLFRICTGLSHSQINLPLNVFNVWLEYLHDSNFERLGGGESSDWNGYSLSEIKCILEMCWKWLWIRTYSTYMHAYIMAQKFGVSHFLIFLKEAFLCWPRLHLCVQKYSKTGILWNIITVSSVGAERKKLCFEVLQFLHHWSEMTLDFCRISYVNTHTHTHTHTHKIMDMILDTIKGWKIKKVKLGTFSHFWRLRYQVWPKNEESPRDKIPVFNLNIF